MAEDARNRRVSPDPAWILPLTPPPGVGIVTPSCSDRTDVLAVPIRTGQGLRIGGEASLCWRCGPGGSVYHPDAGYSMADVRREADRLPFVTGYDPADLTPAVLAEYERDLRDRPRASGTRARAAGRVPRASPGRGTATRHSRRGTARGHPSRAPRAHPGRPALPRGLRSSHGRRPRRAAGGREPKPGAAARLCLCAVVAARMSRRGAERRRTWRDARGYGLVPDPRGRKGGAT